MWPGLLRCLQVTCSDLTFKTYDTSNASYWPDRWEEYRWGRWQATGTMPGLA